MTPLYDIFRRLPDGTPVWVEAVEGLDQARQRLTHLMSSNPADYVIYDLKSQSFIDPAGSSR